MHFPIQFSKRQGDYDFISPVVNFTGNATIIAAAALGAGVIVKIALEALGFSGAAFAASASLLWCVGAVAALGAFAGLGILAAILITFMKALSFRFLKIHSEFI